MYHTISESVTQTYKISHSVLYWFVVHTIHKWKGCGIFESNYFGVLFSNPFPMPQVREMLNRYILIKSLSTVKLDLTHRCKLRRSAWTFPRDFFSKSIPKGFNIILTLVQQQVIYSRPFRISLSQGWTCAESRPRISLCCKIYPSRSLNCHSNQEKT